MKVCWTLTVAQSISERLRASPACDALRDAHDVPTRMPKDPAQWGNPATRLPFVLTFPLETQSARFTLAL